MSVLQEALKARPKASTGWEELAMIYKSMGRLGDAKSAFENAEKAAGRHNFRIEHAETLEQLGDLDGARKVLESLTNEQRMTAIGVIYNTCSVLTVSMTPAKRTKSRINLARVSLGQQSRLP